MHICMYISWERGGKEERKKERFDERKCAEVAISTEKPAYVKQISIACAANSVIDNKWMPAA